MSNVSKHIRNVLIFGSTSGLGWELAHQYLDMGCNVACFSRRLSRLMGFKAVLDDDVHKRNYICAGDIRNKKEVADFIKSFIKEFRMIDLIVVNSGVYLAGGGFEDSRWRSVMETNFWGLYNVLHSIDDIKDSINNKALIVYVSSSLSQKPIKGSAPYSVSKCAAETLVQSVMVEWNNVPNIRVQAYIAPPFRSEMNSLSSVQPSDVARAFVKKVSQIYYSL